MTKPNFGRLTIASMILLTGVALGAGASGAEPVNIEGRWSGGGTVSFASGSNEKARCNVTYRRNSAYSYSASAVCATASGRVAQTARLSRSSDTTFEGSFHNSEYGVSGSVYISVRGGTQYVKLSSDSGSASLKLSR